MNQLRLFEVATVRPGDKYVSGFYFDTKEKAENFLSQQENGEIHNVLVKRMEDINYFDGCSQADLSNDSYDIIIIRE